jgi:hypothetical protein
MMWRFYDLSTGIMRPRRFTGNAELAALNTPPNCAAIPGDFDHLCQCVDISVQPPAPVFDSQGNDISPPWYPPVIDYVPPQPAADKWNTWAWDVDTKRWVAVPTLASIKRDARQRMAAKWDEARSAGVVIGGKTAPTDADAWTRYLAIKAMSAEAGWVDVPIPLADGSFELLTQAKAAALWTALKSMERTLLAQLRDRVQAIDAAATAEEVSAVVWS